MENILDGKITETRNIKSMNMDRMPVYDLLKLMNDEDKKVPYSVEKVLPEIEKAVLCVIDSFKKGGRLLYIGAGTSGRLGVLDAVECPPTFGVSSNTVIGLIAGGEKAFVQAQEGAEDSTELAVDELKNINLQAHDVVCAIAASGRTPYCIGGLQYAKSIGCRTIAIACNKNSEIGKNADLAIEVEVGPEVLTGSTRLKAGTAQKLILNMITTAAMTGMGKVYENLMIDLKITNEKLLERAKNNVVQITGCTLDEASELLKISDNNVKVAIVMGLLGCTLDEAINHLKQANGFIRKIDKIK
ncbi:N-acetylmuramic acid 6-phosphate etherase [Fusobacterium sp.]|uniref:N-acetylmuramic acid 6-phosphate etherase n=1 Tax=Fusobacterium sp. TaxID=68766 RepID=UPI00396CCCF7